MYGPLAEIVVCHNPILFRSPMERLPKLTVHIIVKFIVLYLVQNQSSRPGFFINFSYLKYVPQCSQPISCLPGQIALGRTFFKCLKCLGCITLDNFKILKSDIIYERSIRMDRCRSFVITVAAHLRAGS